MAWLLVSAMYRLPLAALSPAGSFRLASERPPSALPVSPLPMKDSTPARVRKDLLDLVVVGVGNQQVVLPHANADGVLKANHVANTVEIAELEQVHADDSINATAGIEVRRPDRARLAVGEVEQGARQ